MANLRELTKNNVIICDWEWRDMTFLKRIAKRIFPEQIQPINQKIHQSV